MVPSQTSLSHLGKGQWPGQLQLEVVSLLLVRRFGIALLLILAACSRDASAPVTVVSPAIDHVGEDKTVVYFFKADEDETGSPHSYEAVPIRVEDSASLEDHISRTLNRMIRGTSAAQSDAGLFSPFDGHPGASVKDVVAKAGAVVVDFTGIEQMLIDSASPPGSALLLVPIYMTVFQFSEVRTVELRQDGSCAALHGALGGSCEIMTRADYEGWKEAWSRSE